MAIGDTIGTGAQPATDGEGDDAAPRSGHSWNAYRVLRTAVRNVADMVLPPLCLACHGRIDAHDSLCPACWRNITFIRPPLCDRLGLPLPYDAGGTMVSAAAEADPPDYDRARAVAVFSGPMRDLVHNFKFRDTHDARRLFGRWMAEAGAMLIRDTEIMVPVPLTRRRLIGRRFNQAQILSAELARITGKPQTPFVLHRIKDTRQQARLTRQERHRNMAGAFSVPAPVVGTVAGKSVLLIDDVITTGATASAAARALKKAGARRVDVLVLALVADHLSQS